MVPARRCLCRGASSGASANRILFAFCPIACERRRLCRFPCADGPGYCQRPEPPATCHSGSAEGYAQAAGVEILLCCAATLSLDLAQVLHTFGSMVRCSKQQMSSDAGATKRLQERPPASADSGLPTRTLYRVWPETRLAPHACGPGTYGRLNVDQIRHPT